MSSGKEAAGSGQPPRLLQARWRGGHNVETRISTTSQLWTLTIELSVCCA